MPKPTWVGGECPQFPILRSANPLCAQRLCVIFFPSVIPVPAATWLGARATFVRWPLPFPHRCILFIATGGLVQLRLRLGLEGFSSPVTSHRSLPVTSHESNDHIQQPSESRRHAAS